MYVGVCEYTYVCVLFCVFVHVYIMCVVCVSVSVSTDMVTLADCPVLVG